MKQKPLKPKYPYPSRFGSHKAMIVYDFNEEWIICKDENGLYETPRKKLDDGLSDPHRLNREARR